MGVVNDAYFERMYRDREDPWGFTDRWYEERKRALTMAMLPCRRFRRVFEPGCSIGNLTALLVDRWDEILASDIVDAALHRARERLSEAVSEGRARVQKWSLRWSWPDEVFDLIVLSEVCFYVTAPELDRLLDSACAHLDAGGVLLAAHWRHVVDDYPMTADAAHERLRRHRDLRSMARYIDADVVIETFCRASDPVGSVAEEEGLVTPRSP
jgi:SAM-dependent methyltransferase